MPVPVDRGKAVHESLVDQLRDLREQADELRVKKQSGIVWMALAMMVKTRLWLGGEVSAQRDLPLIRRLSKRVKGAVRHGGPLDLYGWLGIRIRAMRETFRRSRAHGHGRGHGFVRGAMS